MKFLLVALMAMSAAAHAQVYSNGDVETVNSGMGEENLAPVQLKRTVGVSSTAAGMVSASAPVAADPFVVKNVVVTLSGTTGFDRDAALEQAARQAMPGVLVAMGLDGGAASKTVKSLGSALTFVKTYKVVKESLIPSYTLTSDLTFNESMLRKNFGGKIAAPVMAVSASVSGEGNAEAAVGSGKPVNQWVVRIAERDPAVVDRVRVNLNKQAGTQATYRLLTSGGAELEVNTPLSAADVTRLAGHPVEVVELEIPLPSGMVETGVGNPRAWQGQAQPDAPSVPQAPNAPADPNAGMY